MNHMRTLIEKMSGLVKHKGFMLSVLVVFVLVCSWSVGYAAEDGIGAEARARAAEAAGMKKEVAPEAVKKMAGLVQTLVVVLLILVIGMIALAARLVKFDPFKKWDVNRTQGTLMILFGIALFAFTIWQMFAYTHHSNIYSNSASEHGKSIDVLFWITITITMIVFFVIHILLFLYSYQYRKKAGSFALFYPDNHKLEFGLTALTAFGLVIMVSSGLKFWYDTFHPSDEDKKNMVHFEVVGEQFKWNLRYAGKDSKLGNAQFRLISDTNPMGIDSADKATGDDVFPVAKEIHLPINRMAKVSIRSKDVLHGVYMPQFRVNIYAVPGMPTEFYFKPIKTTAEMRKDLNNPNFNYEMACSQLCGASHWNMKMTIVVEDEKDYNKWLATQPTVKGAGEEKQLANSAQ
jgi:cytochrome c oxidase subunit II